MEDSPQDPVALGSYQILRKLGEGGMGTVFLALSPGFRLVALKMIRPEYGRDPGFRTRFRQERNTEANSVSSMCSASRAGRRRRKMKSVGLWSRPNP